MAVFIPFLFSSDFLIKLLARHIGVSIISTLSVSLFVSLLLIPMGVHFILKRRKKVKREAYQEVSLDNRLVRIYLSLLKTALRNPAPTIIGVLILFFGTILTTLSVSVNKLSELETNQINLYVTMPTGTTLDATDALVSGMEQALMEIEEYKEQRIGRTLNSIVCVKGLANILLKELFSPLCRAAVVVRRRDGSYLDPCDFGSDRNNQNRN